MHGAASIQFIQLYCWLLSLNIKLNFYLNPRNQGLKYLKSTPLAVDQPALGSQTMMHVCRADVFNMFYAIDIDLDMSHLHIIQMYKIMRDA